jgi:hypothetical protein
VGGGGGRVEVANWRCASFVVRAVGSGSRRRPYDQAVSIHLIVDTPDVVYYHRLYALASAVVEQSDGLFAATAEAEQQEHYRSAAPRLHAQIDAILINAANIRKMVKTSSRRRRDEPPSIFRFRLRRASAFAKLLEGLDLSETLNTTARNSVEHFEEYLDREIATALGAKKRKAVFAGYNMVVHELDMFPLRIYAAAERKYYNMSASIDIAKLRSESESILARLKDSGVLGRSESAGALIFPFDRAE